MSAYCQYWRDKFARQARVEYAVNQRIVAELLLARYPKADDLYLVQES